MDKQYCFIRLNIIFNGKPIKDMTQVTIKNIYTEGDFNLSTGQITYTNKGEMTVTADKPLSISTLRCYLMHISEPALSSKPRVE